MENETFLPSLYLVSSGDYAPTHISLDDRTTRQWVRIHIYNTGVRHLIQLSLVTIQSFIHVIHIQDRTRETIIPSPVK